MEVLTMKSWQIKRRKSIGQQLTEAWNPRTERWEIETQYGEPSFIATRERAKQILKEIKEDQRMPVPVKWVRLYHVVG